MFRKLLGYMFRKLLGYMFQNRFTGEQFATVAQTCPVSFNRPFGRGGARCDFDGNQECPAILPKGYVYIRDDFRKYACLMYCMNCGKRGDHLIEDCPIKACDSEVLRRRLMRSKLPAKQNIPLPKNCS